MNDLFKGTLHDFVRCEECGSERRRCDSFLDLSLVIKPFGADKAVGSVEEALDLFGQTEEMDGDNKVECAACARRTKSVKGLRIGQPPYLLQLSLKRCVLTHSLAGRRAAAALRAGAPPRLQGVWHLWSALAYRYPLPPLLAVPSPSPSPLPAAASCSTLRAWPARS